MSYLAELSQVFEENKNADNAQKMATYMQNKFAFYGIPSPLRRDLQKSFLIKNNLPSLENLEELILKLLSKEQREYQYFAIDLLKKHLKLIDVSFVNLYEKMIIQKSWWDTVDLIASTLVADLLQKYPELIKEKANVWIQSENIWLQRTALLFQLKYKDKTDFDLLQHYIQQTAHSEEFFIQKAIGWALRQYSKQNPHAVKNLLEHQKLSKLSRREASKYLDI